jgi:hypothetical protein
VVLLDVDIYLRYSNIWNNERVRFCKHFVDVGIISAGIVLALLVVFAFYEDVAATIYSLEKLKIHLLLFSCSFTKGRILCKIMLS